MFVRSLVDLPHENEIRIAEGVLVQSGEVDLFYHLGPECSSKNWSHRAAAGNSQSVCRLQSAFGALTRNP
jgi:hypothetical protein